MFRRNEIENGSGIFTKAITKDFDELRLPGSNLSVTKSATYLRPSVTHSLALKGSLEIRHDRYLKVQLGIRYDVNMDMIWLVTVTIKKVVT
ncbi:hypothetical protein NPIL_596701 [Nephila pilipes]|uniref:Uncharacterized protein n=1 Tax=Nephila pilipes TaxID=299642 RepID=A0A8X6KCM5_NEPPI|nr:hypothetical protein NPIL_596701 [Nephila pilipes]